MRIDSPLMTNTVATGSFSGSFTGDGTGLTGVDGNPGGSDTQVQFNNNGSFGGSSNLTFDGTNLTVGGKVTATELVTNIVSQSISFATGSNIFGDEITDQHTFTGSLLVTGSTHNIFGNVGIGTTTPDEKLTVEGNISGSGCIQIGTGHANSGTLSSIAGGFSNTVSGNCAFIGGGICNTVNSIWSVIGGGQNNCVFSGTSQFIGGGYLNTGSGAYGFIGGGCGNALQGDFSAYGAIGGGCENTVCGLYSFIGSGQQNYITSAGNHGGVLAGKFNCLAHADSFIIGSCLTSSAACYTFMNNACVAGTVRATLLDETSARRYKECILPLQDQIENINKLNPVEFQWKKDKTKDIGFVAEEVEKIYPDLIAYEEDGEINGLRYSKLTTVLVKALQQQQEQIDKLKAEVKLLKQSK